MLKNILNLEGVTAMNKTAQKTIQGGNDQQAGGDVLDMLLCIRLGGNCTARHMN